MTILNTGLLDLLDEKELTIICKNTDLDLFLAPMKKAPNMYKMYTKRLASLDKKQKMVQTFLPPLAVELYQKGDKQYEAAFEKAALKSKNAFINICEDINVEITEIRDYTIEQLGDLYQNIESVKRKEMPIDFFCVNLKMIEVKLDDDKKGELLDVLQGINDRKNSELERQKEIKTALKNQEKVLNAKFEQEKDKHHKEIKRLSKENVELKNKLESCNKQLETYKKREEDEYEKLLEKWNKDIQKDIERKRKENEQELTRIYKDEVKKISDRVKAEKLKQEELLSLNINEIKEKNRIEEELLKESISSLRDEREVLQNDVNSLKKEIVNIDREFAEKKKLEEDFFANIDDRVYAIKLDEALSKRLYNVPQKKEKCFAEVNSERINDLFAREELFIEEEIERCDSVSNIEDLEADLRDNIDIYFENASDISVTFLSAILSRKAIVMERSAAYIVGSCFSAIIDSTRPYYISIHDSLSVNMEKLIELINSQSNSTIIIDGVLDKYDETLFMTICCECPNKYLLFTLSSIEHVDLLSKSIYSYAIVIDIEEYFKYESDEKMLVSTNNIQEIYKNKNENRSRLCYDKVFRNLVSKKIIRKRNSLDYAEMLCVYHELNGNETIGDVMKKSILFCCDFTNAQDVEKILNRSGLN